MAGTILVQKIAGAVAESGGSLAEVKKVYFLSFSFSSSFLLSFFPSPSHLPSFLHPLRPQNKQISLFVPLEWLSLGAPSQDMSEIPQLLQIFTSSGKGRGRREGEERPLFNFFLFFSFFLF